MNLAGRGALTSALVAVSLVVGCNGQGQTGRTTAASQAAAPVTSSTTPTTPTTPSRPGPSGPTTGGPTLASLSTTSGPVDGGALVTITGTRFRAQGAGATLVVFGLRCVVVQPSSDTRIDVIAPATTVAGAVDVRVVNGLGSALLAGAFQYVPRSASVVFSPSVGHHELGLAGTKITLALRDFAPVSSMTLVSFGSTAAASVSMIDSATLVAEVPDGLTAGAPVTITVEEAGRRVSAPGFLIQGGFAYGDLTVNELCPAPSGLDTNGDGGRSSSADEFVEIVNTTALPVDVSYLTLYDGKAVERHRFPNPTTVPAGGSIVVFGAGTPEGFAKRHESGHAQAATSGELALNNTSDTMELRTLPGTGSQGTTVFIFNFTNPPPGSSLVNAREGQAIRSKPATVADYLPHTQVPGAKGSVSPGVRSDGSKF